MAKSDKPNEAAETKPPESKEKTVPVINRLVKAGLAEKRVHMVPTGNGNRTKRTLYIPRPLGGGLAAFCGWIMDQAITEAEFKAGVKAFENKTAGSRVKARLAGKGGK